MYPKVMPTGQFGLAVLTDRHVIHTVILSPKCMQSACRSLRLELHPNLVYTGVMLSHGLKGGKILSTCRACYFLYHRHRLKPCCLQEQQFLHPPTSFPDPLLVQVILSKPTCTFAQHIKKLLGRHTELEALV